ncbi:hypothetical protein OY671_011450, partial [Metschnikowia pulcherrima]
MGGRREAPDAAVDDAGDHALRERPGAREFADAAGHGHRRAGGGRGADRADRRARSRHRRDQRGRRRRRHALSHRDRQAVRSGRDDLLRRCRMGRVAGPLRLDGAPADHRPGTRGRAM